MSRLTPCPSCHAHVLVAERSCPHCGVSLRTPSARVPALLMGLALTGCPEPEPVYGVPDSGPSEAPDTDSETGAGTETETGGTTTEDSGETLGEPEYGVPDSG